MWKSRIAIIAVINAPRIRSSTQRSCLLDALPLASYPASDVGDLWNKWLHPFYRLLSHVDTET